MNRIWKKEYNLRGSDFDKFNHIKPSAVLDLFQDAAGQHADELGVGFDQMIKRSYLWVLTRIKFKIISQPKSYQRVIIKTWPLEPHRLNYRREYCIESENGESLVSAPDLYPFSDGFHTETMFEEKIAKIRDFESTETPHVVNAGFTELDVNNHVNNTKYANYVLDAINPAETDKTEIFQIDYRKEVLLGTTLKIYYQKEDNIVVAKGENENGDVMFACKLEYKK